MRFLILAVIQFLVSAFVFAQNPVPNSSFENWTAGKPDGWALTSTHVSQTAPGHTGNYAVKISGSGGRLEADSVMGFPISNSYTYLNFYLKFNKVDPEYLSVVATLDSACGYILQGITTGSNSFVAYSLPITPFPGCLPQYCTINFGMDVNVGSVSSSSYFILDDISLSNSPLTAISEPLKDEMHLMVSPNPTSDRLSIVSDNLNDDAIVEVYNSMGEKVNTVFWNKISEGLDVSQLPQGLYFLEVKQQGIQFVKKFQKI